MKAVIITIIGLISSINATSFTRTYRNSSNCGENEVYKYCGSACPASCDPSLGSLWACSRQCIEGCFCKDGYVLNDMNECILRENCPTYNYTSMDTSTSAPMCYGENKEYTTCGSSCPATCDNIFANRACAALCIEGCFCKTGYMYDRYGNCVLEEDCPADMTTTEAPSLCNPECGSGYECVEDDGSGSPGCIMLGGSCDNCYQLRLACGTCPDGSNTFGACDGCTWQETWFGAKCLDTVSYCPEMNTSTIEPSTTAALCGTNEGFTQCNGHCRPTCATGTDIMCSRICRPGCNCEQGYILDEINGECIPEDECPTDQPVSTADPTNCGDNASYSTCKSACPDYCGANPMRVCNMMCYRGCVCDAGYILDSEDGECIPEDECPTEEPSTTEMCGENEEFTDCGTMCPAVCGKETPSFCNFMCFVGCQCKSGYILDSENGECIPEDECATDEPSTTEMCGENEEFTDCGTMCPAICGKESPSFCNFMCFIGCQCKSGYILDEEDGECIPEDECTTNEPSTTGVQCEENEEFTTCGTMCPDYCGATANRMCNRMCFIGCQCKDGYILDEQDGDCIPEDDCPMNGTDVTGVLVDPSDANAYGLIMVFGIVAGVFGWM